MSEKQLMNGSARSTDSEDALWVAFARRFLDPQSYRLGMVVVWMIGNDGARAIIQRLKHIEKRCSGGDSLACNEAAQILIGAIEEMTH